MMKEQVAQGSGDTQVATPQITHPVSDLMAAVRRAQARLAERKSDKHDVQPMAEWDEWYD